MAPTEGRVARPERRWGCRRGTPNFQIWQEIIIIIIIPGLHYLSPQHSRWFLIMLTRWRHENQGHLSFAKYSELQAIDAGSQYAHNDVSNSNFH